MISEFLAERVLRDIFSEIRLIDGEHAFFICESKMLVVKIEKRSNESLPTGVISDAWVFKRPMEILSDESGRLCVEQKIRAILENLRGSA